jgi:hypothetical protein
MTHYEKETSDAKHNKLDPSVRNTGAEDRILDQRARLLLLLFSIQRAMLSGRVKSHSWSSTFATMTLSERAGHPVARLPQ